MLLNLCRVSQICIHSFHIVEGVHKSMDHLPCDGVLYLIFNAKGLRVRDMVFIATFNNISVILWQSDLLVEETGGPGENHQSVTSH